MEYGVSVCYLNWIKVLRQVLFAMNHLTEVISVIKIINYFNRDDHTTSLSKTDNHPLLAIS